MQSLSIHELDCPAPVDTVTFPSSMYCSDFYTGGISGWDHRLFKVEVYHVKTGVSSDVRLTPLKGISDQECRDPGHNRYHRGYWISFQCHNSLSSQSGNYWYMLHRHTYVNKKTCTHELVCVNTQKTQTNGPTKACFRPCCSVREMSSISRNDI